MDLFFQRLETLVQCDVNRRGLAARPDRNLITACAGDLERACHSLADTKTPAVGIVTGFYIPDARAAETDGPLGTVFLARILHELGARVRIAAESFVLDPIRMALDLLDLHSAIETTDLPTPAELGTDDPQAKCAQVLNGLTHLIAIERVGPSHSEPSLQAQGAGPGMLERFRREVPAERQGHYHTMRGRVITPHLFPAHLLFDEIQAARLRTVTIGIGDGGNEIGMGKVPWDVIADNIPNGGLVACRVPARHNLVCGISNWGACALAAGVRRLRGRPLEEGGWFDAEAEEKLWQAVLGRAILVDGVTGRRELTVDGLPWDDYTRPLAKIGSLL